MTEQEFTIHDLNNEEWRPVVGYEKLYSVSSLGRVRRDAAGGRNAKPGRILTLHAGKSHYLILCLNGASKRRTFYAHALVAAAFLGRRPDGLQVNHKDGNKKNNRPENLEYCTVAENVRHAYRLGLNTIRSGDQSPSSKIKDAEIPEIFLFRAAGWKSGETAARYNVSASQIQRILNGTSRRN